MNDVELIAQALLQIGKARFLFSGSKKYGETVELVDKTDKYDLLLITFSNSGLRQTIVSGKDTSEVNVCMNYTSANETSRVIETTRGTLKRINSSAYIIDFVKHIKEKEILLNGKADGFRVISIVGIS